ncbi:hypothetical protein [Rhizobium laguerreae]|uniref:Uncharacterized protein n=1 Tax=Rhizobium laguerreae TaxID=1076926 RepID=A0ABR6G1X0_9HYPH|nr:hypothetical protein [Rhizobium laguerreae]MBB3160255.1 hypothetical protein [Rhizobium laguerreae]UFW62549.1 hypothetical protein RlegWSM1455_13330 [Rhizobium laguerreae]
MTEIGRLLGSGKEAEVFEYGALALKLYRRRLQGVVIQGSREPVDP